MKSKITKALAVSAVLLVAFAVNAAYAGCGACGPEKDGHKHEVKKAEAGKLLCAGCGQVKGSEECCKEGAEKCEKCTLVKGSPGCCKMTAASKGGEDVAYCAKCDAPKEKGCCKKSAAKAAACPLSKGCGTK